MDDDAAAIRRLIDTYAHFAERKLVIDWTDTRPTQPA